MKQQHDEQQAPQVSQEQMRAISATHATTACTQGKSCMVAVSAATVSRTHSEKWTSVDMVNMRATHAVLTMSYDC